MYKLIKNNLTGLVDTICRISDNAYFSINNLANPDYQTYLTWISLGNSPDPVDAPTKAQLNAPIFAQIAALESNQARPLREAALGVSGAVDRIKALDYKIAALRSTLN